MPRQRTKGDRIQVQLPLDVDASVRAKALKQQTSPAAVVEEVVTRSVRAKVIPIDRELRIDPALGTDDPACTHPKSKVQVTSSAGLHRCSCGAVRGVDGSWR